MDDPQQRTSPGSGHCKGKTRLCPCPCSCSRNLPWMGLHSTRNPIRSTSVAAAAQQGRGAPGCCWQLMHSTDIHRAFWLRKKHPRKLCLSCFLKMFCNEACKP